jgi:nitrite reductase/ring-hydroxylating ferredoxin subunit
MCRSHGAQFDISTGLCVAGPCVGAHLRSLAVRIEHGYVMLLDDPDTLAAQLA